MGRYRDVLDSLIEANHLDPNNKEIEMAIDAVFDLMDKHDGGESSDECGEWCDYPDSDT